MKSNMKISGYINREKVVHCVTHKICNAMHDITNENYLNYELILKRPKEDIFI